MEKQAEKVGMFGAIRNYLKFYAAFRGRSSRSEYWYLWLAGLLANLLWFSVLLLFSELRVDPEGLLTYIVVLTPLVMSIGLVIPTFAVMARRLRDAGFSPYLLFLLFAPGGGIALWVMMLWPSKPLATGLG